MNGPDTRLDLLRRTVRAYEKLSADDRDGNWPELTLVVVNARHDPIDSADEVLDHLRRAERVGEGWVRYRSRVARFADGNTVWVPSEDQEAGPPIAAEWSEPGFVSYQFRPFALWRYEERELPDGAVLREDEHPVLRQCIWALEHPAPRQAARGDRIPCLAYHVFWGADKADPSALRRLFARFVGFERREDRFVADSQRRREGR